MTQYLYVGCVTLILFIILLVIGKRKKVLSDYIFLAWMVILLTNFATFIVISRYDYPASFAGRLLVEFSEASVFLHGPVFLFYTLSLTSPTQRIHFRQAIHLVPFVICLLFLLEGAWKGPGVSNGMRLVFTLIKMISLLAYTTGVIIQLRKHRDQVESIFSNTERKNLGWLNFLAWGIICVWGFSCLGLLLYNVSGINIPQYGAVAGNLALSCLIFLIGYYGVRQEAIFNFTGQGETILLPNQITRKTEADDIYAGATMDDLVQEVPVEETQVPAAHSDKYKNSGLTKQKAMELFEALTLFMQHQKPYQESELTLFGLAKQFKIHPNHLSQIINQHRNQNFFDYINEQRVIDVKKALLSPDYYNHSFLGIAHEFGFNSKASFNRAFKKFTGMTPSEFKRTAS